MKKLMIIIGKWQQAEDGYCRIWDNSVLCPFDETGICDRLYDYYKTSKNEN